MNGLRSILLSREAGILVMIVLFCLAVGAVKPQFLTLNSLRIMPTSLQQLLSLNIEPEKKKVIVVKGVTAPRAAYEPIAKQIIAVDSSGVTQAGPEAFHYVHRPKPLFPLEPL